MRAICLPGSRMRLTTSGSISKVAVSSGLNSP
jgi:hypothetical protein